jgi:hypothetical protein
MVEEIREIIKYFNTKVVYILIKDVINKSLNVFNQKFVYKMVEERR